MFEGFERRRVAANGVEINLVMGGKGPPVLLLHGYPQTHAIWRKIAPRLAEHWTVVASDLRGYGDSSKPPGLPDHSNYSKREMARDQLEVMRALGFDRFHLVGHDRGARVAHRLAADHPQAVSRIAVLDIAPTKAMYEHTTMGFARAYYHWFFLIQPAPFPETLIGAKPEAYLRHHMTRFAWLQPFMPEGWPEYLRCFSDPGAIHASCEDYRAAASIDLKHDGADLAAGRKLRCPLLALWGAHGIIAREFDALAEWRKVAADVHGGALPCGHYIPEEAPDALAHALSVFLEG